MGTPAQFAWQPSTARLVVVQGFGPFPRGTWCSTPPALCWPTKDPGDTLDYVVDLSEALAGDDGDGIATLDVAVSPSNSGDLSVVNTRADGGQAVIWLTGGFSGTTYAVTATIGTNSGRVVSRTISLPVMSLSTASPFGNDITDQSGEPLSDQSGNPITVS